MTTSSKKTPNAIPKRIMAHAVLFGVVVSVIAPGTPADAKTKKPKLSAKKVTENENHQVVPRGKKSESDMEDQQQKGS